MAIPALEPGIGSLTEAEWEQLASYGCTVTTAESIRERQRTLFSRQLAAASDSLTFLFS